MKRDFLEAYRAGGQAVERDLKRDWKTVVIFVMALVISDLVERWLAAHYSLPSYANFMLSIVAAIPVLAALFALRRKLDI
jgi:hypothetical protein